MWGVMESMALKMRGEQLVSSSVLLRSHLVPAVQFQAPDFNRGDHKRLEESCRGQQEDKSVPGDGCLMWAKDYGIMGEECRFGILVWFSLRQDLHM